MAAALRQQTIPTPGRRFAARLGRATRRRYGIASVLAMLYLILFAVMAIGFYAATSMAAQISRNERRLTDSQLAAESGLQFMRYELGQVDISTKTLQTDLLPKVCSELGRLMNSTGNMGGNTVQITNNAIYIPSPTGVVPLDTVGNKSFRATITQSGAFLIVKVTGYCSDPNITRSVQMNYAQAPRASALFDFGVASKGKIVTGGTAVVVGQGDPTRGSVLSTSLTDPTPVVIGGKMVSGDISIANPAGSVSYGSASIGGTKDPTLIPNHIHKGVTPPDFPDIDTSAYTAYATTPWDGTSNTLFNNYIPAGMNPSFTGGATITGILYIKAPNVVNFGGNLTINGAIVVENNVTLNPATNQINFKGTVTSSPINTPGLGLPAGEDALTGAFLLAPGFNVSFTGDFGSIGGHIIASSIGFSGNAGGTIKGSIVNLANTELDINGSSDIVIAATGTTNYPTGVTFGVKYVPLPDTYVETP
jgi:hypothetical protein